MVTVEGDTHELQEAGIFHRAAAESPLYFGPGDGGQSFTPYPGGAQIFGKAVFRGFAWTDASLNILNLFIEQRAIP